jgi:hypothetical protein
MVAMNENSVIAKALGKARKHLPKPLRVERLEFSLGKDQIGDPAVFVVVVIEETAKDADWSLKDAERVEEVVRKELVATGNERYVYFSFSKPSELRPMEE